MQEGEVTLSVNDELATLRSPASHYFCDGGGWEVSGSEAWHDAEPGSEDDAPAGVQRPAPEPACP